MKRILIIALVGALAIVAQDVSAKDTKPKVDPEAVRVMHDFGRCVGQSRTSARLLSTLPYSPEEQALAGRIANSDCLRGGGELRFRAPLLRGLVAEQLYLYNFAGDRPRGTAAPVFADPAPAVLAAASDKQRSAVTMIRFGACVASIDKAGIVALFKTPATSASERKAYAAFQPALGRCIESGASFHMNPFTLRGFLAEGAYRQAAEEAKKSNG